jgi:signal transduction histidine kinase
LEECVAQRTAELVLASRAKDDFLSIMSHELRTPLNAVLGLTEAIREGVYGPVQPRQDKALSRVDESGHRLLTLINDILEVSRVDISSAKLDLEPVVVDDVCQASLRLVHEGIKHKQLTVTTRVGPEVPAIRADKRLLKQILVHLLSNAVKFTPERGSIELEATLDTGGSAVRFTVRDTGIGIAPADLPRLFQRFGQLDAGLTRRYGGTGLGLVLVRRFTELHGGRVEVESEPGVGSRFSVVLPISGCAE